MIASARGLFRATGKTAKPSAIRTLDGYGKAESQPREENDFYPTPPEPTRALLRAEMARLRDFPVIWEPACGDGAMVREIRAAGHEVVGSDMIDRGAGGIIESFYNFAAPIAPAIVTNPPFQECNTGKWIRHALETLQVEYMALLLPLNWPGALSRAGLWSTYPPARVYLMRWRIDFTGAGAPPMLNAWFVWDRAHQGETVLRMLDRTDDARQEPMI